MKQAMPTSAFTAVTLLLLGHHTTYADLFQRYQKKQAAFDYHRLPKPEEGSLNESSCKAACDKDVQCLTSTFVPSLQQKWTSLSQCYVSSTDVHTLVDTLTTLDRKQNRAQCGLSSSCHGSQECPRFDYVTNTCVNGFTCSCSCFTNNDCEQNQMDLGCNQCTNQNALSGLGSCTHSSSPSSVLPDMIKAKEAPTCGYTPSKNSLKNVILSEDLDLVLMFDTMHAWSSVTSQFASALLNNLTVAQNFARVSIVRAGVVNPAASGAATGSTKQAVALVNLTSHNDTLNRILSMAPTQAGAAIAAIDPFVDALELSASMFVKGRRAVLIVVSSIMPINVCVTVRLVNSFRTGIINSFVFCLLSFVFSSFSIFLFLDLFDTYILYILIFSF